MPTPPHVTSLAADKDVADQVRNIAKELGVSTLDVTNALLRLAMSQNELKVEVKTVSFNPKTVGKRTPAKRTK